MQLDETISKLKNYDFLHAVLSNVPAVVFVIAPDGTIVFAEGKSIALAGLKSADVVGTNISEYFSMYPGFEERVRRALSGETLTSFATAPNRRSFEVTYSPLRDDQGSICYVIGAAFDITERMEQERALRESESMLRAVFESAQDSIFIEDRSFRYVKVSPAMEQLFGLPASELVGKTDEDLFGPEAGAHLREVDARVLDGEVVEEENTKPVNGEPRSFHVIKAPMRDAAGAITGLCGIARDITERKRAQEEKDRLQQQLQQSQKLEAIGTMAGGIAHDFNNILSAMLGFTELVRSEIAEDSESYENLTEVVRAGQRARDLVNQILSFTRKARTEKSVISLVTIVSEALKLIRSIVSSHITIKQNFAVSAERSVLADPTQIHQIMLNLCINAADAMPDGGVLEISLDEAQVETENRPEQTYLPSGCYLKLTVRDSGVGMMPDVLERIFEPYFTTKQIGKGTGMGLAVVHGVVEEHGGNITVSSEVGKGTAVTVWLPVAEAALHTPVVSTPVITTGSGLILFVDDETMIVNLQRTQLSRWGYRVTATASSSTALEMFRADPQGYDLLITDQSMPDITGLKLAQAVHEINPSTPIILCTGFDDGISREYASMIGIRAILTKPVSGAELSRTIRSILDKARKPS